MIGDELDIRRASEEFGLDSQFEEENFHLLETDEGVSAIQYLPYTKLTINTKSQI